MARPKNDPDAADYYACPGCGAEVRVGSRGCPKCTDKPRSWEENYEGDGLDLPGDGSDFDYDEFVRREFGKGSGRIKPPGIRWYWWLTALVLVLLMVLSVVWRMF